MHRRVADGQPEMVMTGISVGDYRDPERGLELGDLMCEVARVPGVERVRLSSVEVIHVKDSLLRALTDEPKVCPHLHVPMQSGDDAVLRDMGRHYDSAEYLDHIARLRRAAPDVNLTTDVIVGFPTEDEAAFERTLKAVDTAGISRVHAFPYSPRPGTDAERLGDRVAPPEKKRRGQVLRGRSEVRSRLHRSAKLGERQIVLIDKVADTQCSGYTADYTRCYLPAGAGSRGELLAVTARELHADGIRCAECRAPGAPLVDLDVEVPAGDHTPAIWTPLEAAVAGRHHRVQLDRDGLARDATASAAPAINRGHARMVDLVVLVDEHPNETRAARSARTHG